MGGVAKSGTHLAAANQATTFFFFWNSSSFRGQFSLNSAHIGSALQKKKKKGQHLICCSFYVTFGSNRHRARVPCQNTFTYRDRRLNTVVLAMPADSVKNRDFRSFDRDKA